MKTSGEEMKVPQIFTEEQAREFAIEWQAWAAEQSLSYEELATWAEVFQRLGNAFNLTEEFYKEGIL